MKVLSVLLYLIIYLNYFVQSEDASIFMFNSLDNCKFNEYFDDNYLNCKLCDAAVHLVASRDRLSCSCQDNATVIIEYDNLSKLPTCRENLNCENSTAALTENCTNSNNTINRCSIKFIKVLASSIQTKHFQLYRLENSTNCTCNSKVNVLYQSEYCIPKILLKDYAINGVFKSQPIFEDLPYLNFLCHQLKMRQFCNQLANLCILSNYNLDNGSPCSIFYISQTSVLGIGNDYFDKTFPFLFYRKSTITKDDLEKVIGERYSLDDKDNEIVFLETSYHLNGQLNRIQKLNLLHLYICEDEKAVAIKFGHAVNVKCRISLNRMVEIAEYGSKFLTLYLNYTENGMHLLKSVPVLIRNFFQGNEGENRENWQLVKRFNLFDTFTDLIPISPSFVPYKDVNLIHKYNSIQYVNEMELRFDISANHDTDGNKISTPVLILKYGQINGTKYRGLNDTHKEFVDFNFKISFHKNYNFDAILDIELSILIAIGFLYSCFETYCYKTRQQKAFYDGDIFLNFFINLSSNIGTALFVSAIFLSFYILILFKSQTIIKILLPVQEQEVIQIFIYTAVVLKTIKVLHQFWQQSNVDIFFIDWERPKSVDQTYTNLRSSNIDATPSISSGDKLLSHDSVSAWRTYFVSNEWLRLTTKRRSSIALQVLIVSLFVMLFDSQTDNFNWSGFDILTFSGDDLTIRIALGICIYSLVYLAQRILNLLLYERYVNNSIQKFVDLCSIANISLFCFYINSFGFYIHGRSPHGFSDTDMCTMVTQLQREEENMCGYRGLLPTSEQQTYSFLAPNNLRKIYDKLVQPIRQYTSNGAQNPQIVDFSNKFTDSNEDKMTVVYYSLNRFLSVFIDHGLKDLDYGIHEKTFIEKIFGFEYGDDVTENRGKFYFDTGHSFDQLILYGCDFFLFQYELLLFVFVIAITNNFYLAIFLVGIVNKIIEVIFKSLQLFNLSRKTLIDKRFLIT